MSTAAKTKQSKQEISIIEEMSKAKKIADKVFGATSSTYAVFEIHDYLAVADEEMFALDLARIYDSAKSVFETTSPTPEQVFGLFERVFHDDDEE